MDVWWILELLWYGCKTCLYGIQCWSQYPIALENRPLKWTLKYCHLICSFTFTVSTLLRSTSNATSPINVCVCVYVLITLTLLTRKGKYNNVSLCCTGLRRITMWTTLQPSCVTGSSRSKNCTTMWSGGRRRSPREFLSCSLYKLCVFLYLSHLYRRGNTLHYICKSFIDG